ncbi:hypothetical protein [Streptomyces sp. NPDC050264]|uniref:hypothetical protein n=1 Tax=Streptomyces sp. NPDC050264 TaxID=3155038 RepID=UPI0034476E82
MSMKRRVYLTMAATGALLLAAPCARGGRARRLDLRLPVVGPGIDTVGLTTLPEERHARYRIRAFRQGPGSDVVHRTTGAG